MALPRDSATALGRALRGVGLDASGGPNYCFAWSERARDTPTAASAVADFPQMGGQRHRSRSRQVSGRRRRCSSACTAAPPSDDTHDPSSDATDTELTELDTSNKCPCSWPQMLEQHVSISWPGTSSVSFVCRKPAAEHEADPKYNEKIENVIMSADEDWEDYDLPLEWTYVCTICQGHHHTENCTYAEWLASIPDSELPYDEVGGAAKGENGEDSGDSKMVDSKKGAFADYLASLAPGVDWDWDWDDTSDDMSDEKKWVLFTAFPNWLARMPDELPDKMVVDSKMVEKKVDYRKPYWTQTADSPRLHLR